MTSTFWEKNQGIWWWLVIAVIVPEAYTDAIPGAKPKVWGRGKIFLWATKLLNVKNQANAF